MAERIRLASVCVVLWGCTEANAYETAQYKPGGNVQKSKIRFISFLTAEQKDASANTYHVCTPKLSMGCVVTYFVITVISLVKCFSLSG